MFVVVDSPDVLERKRPKFTNQLLMSGSPLAGGRLFNDFSAIDLERWCRHLVSAVTALKCDDVSFNKLFCNFNGIIAPPVGEIGLDDEFLNRLVGFACIS